MPEYLVPGVYIEEIEIGAKPIEGVSTSTAAFIGGAKFGPILEPTLVTSWSDFETTFGGLMGNPRLYLGYAVDAFFRNGGERAYIVRVASDNANKAHTTLNNGENKEAIVVEASEVGVYGNNIKVDVSSGSIATDVEVAKKQTNIAAIKNRDITVVDATGFEVGDVVLIQDSTTTTTKETARIKTIVGNIVTLESDLANTYTITNASKPVFRFADISIGAKEIRLVDASKFFPGSVVHIAAGTNEDYGIVDKITGKRLILRGSLTNAYALNALNTDVPKVTSLEFNLTVKKDEPPETFSLLSMDPAHPRFFKRIVDSKLVNVSLPDTPAAPASAKDLNPKTVPYQPLLEGRDDIYTNINYSKGIPCLEKVEGISIVAIPGQTTKAIQQDLIDHCEKMYYRFAILDSDPKAELSNSPSIIDQRDSLDSKKGYVALYYPWLKVSDPLTQDEISVPPSGAVAGIYARSDTMRGVHKAPANETVAGTVGPDHIVTRGEQQILNPKGINVIRSFPGKGTLVWGARTISSDPLWKYINVRRLFIYLEASIEKNTQWVVFEPNNEKLWARVKQTITQFLTEVWKDGALMGTTPQEAFFVKCDRTTMTQNDIDNGRLIVLIGVAPVKPAEFVIFKIAQWAGGSEPKE